MEIQKKIYLNTAIEVKGMGSSADDPSILKIAGYANYASTDRGNEIIEPEAWKKGIVNYLKNPVVLFGHDMNKPIGTVTNIKIDNNGIHVEANISSAAERLYGTQQLIKDGALKAFSVGFYPKKGKKDTATDILHITDLELLETSVVSVPMNQDSLFSVVKSMDAVDRANFLASVEEFDSTKEMVQMSEKEINISVNVTGITDNSSEMEMGGEPMGEDPMEMSARQSVSAAIKDLAEKKKMKDQLVKKNYASFIASLHNKISLKIDNKLYNIVEFKEPSRTIAAQEVTILGTPINKILNIDWSSLVMLNLDQIETAEFAEFRTPATREPAEIIKTFKKLTASSVDYQAQQVAYLNEKTVENWNSDDYVAANKIITYMLYRENEVKNKLQPNHVEEIQMDTTSTEDTSVTAPVAAVTVQEPKVLGIASEASAALAAVDTAREQMVSVAQLKAVEDQLASVMAEFNANKERFAAANNEKVAYVVNNGSGSSKYNAKDLAIATILAYGRNPGKDFSLETFKSTNLGKGILEAGSINVKDFETGISTKATITTVDALITEFTSQIYNQLQIELKVAPLLKTMDIVGQHFKIPVADEDTNGDIAMFANGTYNVGETDSTRVPTTRQNTITAVDLTPHKFMGTTHLAKDEQEDVLIPLMQFQIDALVRRMARAIDKSLLRGDGSLTGFTASPTNAITAGTGYASVITGLVTLAAAQSGLKVASGGNSTKATPAKIAAARALMGRYGLDNSPGMLVYFTSIEGYNDLVTTADFQTVNTFGESRATYLTGQLGSIYGIPVVVTEFMDNVGVSGNHIGALVYLPGFIVGRRRAIEVETWYDPRRQLNTVYLSTRFDLKALTTVANAALNTTGYSMASVITSNN